MPNILIYTTDASDRLISHNIDELGLALRQATAEALGDISRDDVAVLKIKLSECNNMTAMQIFAIGNSTTERKRRLETWAALLARAWRTFATRYHIDWIENVDVWPTLLDGYWMKAAEKDIQKLIRIV